MPTTIELERDITRFELASGRAPALPKRTHPCPPEQPVLSIRAAVPKAEAEIFIAEALRDIRVFMQEHDVRPAGPPFTICRPQGSDLDIEAGWPTMALLTGTTRINSGALPRSLTGQDVTPIPSADEAGSPV